MIHAQSCFWHTWAEVLWDLQDVLETLPRCRQLLDTFRASPNTQNKTPLAILHEYSSRFNLEVCLSWGRSQIGATQALHC